MIRKRIDESDIQEAIRAVNAGERVHDVADRLCISATTIRRAMREELGVCCPESRVRVSQRERDRIYSLGVNPKLTVPEIAQIVGRPIGTVKEVLRANPVVMAARKTETPQVPLRIGLNAEFCRRSDDTGFAVLESGYYQCLACFGAAPMILPPVAGKDDEVAVQLDRMLDTLDGLVLVGSDRDLDPNLQGCMRHARTRPMDETRERFDRRLVQRAAARKLPLLAIGAGMQLLNVCRGGTLSLHLPEDFPKAMPHCDPNDPQCMHYVMVEEGSFVDLAYESEDGRLLVHSRHHMGVDDVAPGFAVTARAPDRVVEAIESTDPDWLAVGVQWHPESRHATMIDPLLFRFWLEQVRTRQKSPADDPPPEKPELSVVRHEEDVAAATESERLLSRAEAAQYLGLSLQYMHQLAHDGFGPPYVKRHGWTWYRREDLDAWNTRSGRRKRQTA